MKTNHQRGFKETRKGLHPHTRIGGDSKHSDFADVTIGASWGGDASNGTRGFAAQRAGGKKYIRSRIRFHENQELNRQVKDL